ncbi:MAG TPA: cupin domain-containing protein [Solirubrobacteraceae bacterium]|nr:cupin domain-containing protein [Solirubrobacteraceae bacterium]
MRRFNLHTADLEADPTDPDGYRATERRLHPEIGASMMAGRLYELPPGQSNCPYHYELGDEEWLIVLAGVLTVRHPGGEDELEPGDVVCFRAGPEGAHKLTNRGAEPVRMLIVSTRNMPAVAVYPDSDKIGVFTEGRTDDIMVRREAGVDYWDGER